MINHERFKQIIRASIAHDSLLDFMQFTWRNLEPLRIGRHTRAITDRLDRAMSDFAAGKSSYLMITVPPRHGKSEIVSRNFPAFFFGHFPDAEIILSSYNQDLANQMSRAARSTMRSSQFQQVFFREKISISPESASVSTWQIARHAGKFQAIGIGGGSTGKGAHLLIVDDYLRGRADAESETIRNKQWDDFAGNLITRLAPVHIVVILATPWHSDDIIGRIKNRMNPQHRDFDPDFPRFEQMKFSARNPDGSFLFPERFSEAWYKTQFSVLGSYQAAALLLCEPVPRGGAMLKTDRVKIIEPTQMPQNIVYCRFWDLASTEKERAKDDPDFSAGALVGAQFIQGVWHIFIKDVRFIQAEAPARNRLIIDTARADSSAVPVGVESVAGYKDTFTTIRDLLRGEVVVRKISVSRDKIVRASEMESVFEAGNVHICRGWWNDETLRQLAQFPAGAHDDIVDAVAGAFEMAKKYAAPGALVLD